MYIARAERRTALVVPTVAMTLLLNSCGGDAGSGDTEDTTANGNDTAASAPADATESAATSGSTDTSESPEDSNGPPAEQDVEEFTVELTSGDKTAVRKMAVDG